MGLSFYYSGSLSNAALLPAMIEEVRDIADVLNWPYYIYETSFLSKSFEQENHNKRIYGISFTPEKCETVFLCFLSNGKMSGPDHVRFYADSKDENEKRYLYMLSVKTQFAGAGTHKMMIQLFKYLRPKYFSSFQLSDEGHYWETGDEKLLDNRFEEYSFLINSFSNSLQTTPMKAGENMEAYFMRLMQEIDRNRKK